MFVVNLHRKTAYLFFYSDIRVIINKIIKYNKQNEKNDNAVFLFRNKHHCQFVITVFSSVKRLFSSLIESNQIESNSKIIQIYFVSLIRTLNLHGQKRFSRFLLSRFVISQNKQIFSSIFSCFRNCNIVYIPYIE